MKFTLPRACAVPLTALGLLLAACTGTSEERTPVALLIAGSTGSGSVLDVYASGLPPDLDAPSDPLTHLPNFREAVAGTVIALLQPDLETIGTRYLLHRTTQDLLTQIDVGTLDVATPASLMVDPTPIELGTHVAASGALPDVTSAADLCARGATVSNDGRWLGILHDGRACGNASSVPTVLLLDLASDPPRTYPVAASTNDAPVIPAIDETISARALLWPTLGSTAAIRAIMFDTPSDSPLQNLSLAGRFENATAIGVGADGLLIAESDRFARVDPNADDDPFGPVWEPPASLGAITRFASVRGVPGTPALAVAESGLAFVPDVRGDPSQVRVASAAIAPFADVTVGPYGYAFAIGNASAVVYDLLTAWSTGPSTLRGTTVALASDVAAVAVTWTFAADTRETTAP